MLQFLNQVKLYESREIDREKFVNVSNNNYIYKLEIRYTNLSRK